MTKPSCCKAKTTHTTMTSYDKRVCNTYTFRKIEQDKLTAQQKKN